MSPAFGGRVEWSRLLLAVVIAGVFGILLVLTDQPLTLPVVGFLIYAGLGFFAMSFERVRADERYHLGHLLWLAGLFSLLVLSEDSPSVFPLVMLALALVGVVVEAYNYWHGTEYLRLG